ncbi:hypothetical protein [Fretibacter rubidus]|uniref:hypothetical protein n=1 Tax=Fretibacter rubidus TaxID=570162 RepID=UPI00352BAF77
MGKFTNTAIIAGIAMIAFAGSASAVDIKDNASCTAEGGTMVNVKNSDYCLVPIRDEAYADPIYDGNQLGIVDCPGNKLQDGQYCMYPVTIRPAPAQTTATTPSTSDALTTAPSMDSAVDSMEEMATDVVDDMK